MIGKFLERVCSEYWKIENYEKAVDDEKNWELHHRLEVSEDGLHTIYSCKKLKQLNMYYHRPPEELIFLTISDHYKLHKNTIEYRKKLSNSKKGITSWNKGKTFSKESRQKMSKAKKGTPQTKFKWVDPNGEIHYMAICNVMQWHPDWKKIEEDV